MEKHRCGWCVGDRLYEEYHDLEWGVPVKDDRKLFEFLVLESFQAGLSWITILRKRENFRQAFDQFDYDRIAVYPQSKIDALLLDPGIIRNKLKINATVGNARAFLKIREDFGSFATYLWQFIDGKPLQNHWTDYKQAPARTDISDALAKDLKKRNFKFTGSTVMYAYMQAMGLVNDHEVACFRHQELQK